jgi:hypothetical protein
MEGWKMSTATATVEPTFEQRLIDALTSDISADDLYVLVEETKTAITTADNDAEIAKAMALDPVASPDPVKAKQVMEAAAFNRDRLRNLLPRLQTRLTEVGNHEDYVSWRKRYDPLVPKVEDAAAKLTEIYLKFAAELMPLLAEIEKIDIEVSQVSSAKPYHAKQANGDGCILRSVELTARGLEGFSSYAHKIMKMELPDLEHQDKLLWPPNRYVDYSNITPVFRHPGANWHEQAQEEVDRKRAEATRLEAELQQQEGRNRDMVAKTADDRMRGIIAL